MAEFVLSLCLFIVVSFVLKRANLCLFAILPFKGEIHFANLWAMKWAHFQKKYSKLKTLYFDVLQFVSFRFVSLYFTIAHCTLHTTIDDLNRKTVTCWLSLLSICISWGVVQFASQVRAHIIAHVWKILSAKDAKEPIICLVVWLQNFFLLFLLSLSFLMHFSLLFSIKKPFSLFNIKWTKPKKWMVLNIFLNCIQTYQLLWILYRPDCCMNLYARCSMIFSLVSWQFPIW